MSDHSDDSLGIPYYSDSTSGGTLSLTSIVERNPATLIVRNDDNVERIKEWVAWVDGTGDFPPAADEPMNPVYESFLEHTTVEHQKIPVEVLEFTSHTNFLPIKPRRLPIEAKQRAFARWLQSRGPWDVLRHQSPPACIEGHILESTWWENADLHFPLYMTGEVDHGAFVTKVLKRSAIAPLHKITVIIAVETNIHGLDMDPWSMRSREKHYGEFEVDMSEWLCMLEGHVHDGPPEEIVERIDARFWTQEQEDEYDRKRALENGWTEEDLAEWWANLKVVDWREVDADDEMGDDIESDDSDDEDGETATNYSLTPIVLKALKKSLPPHLVEALKNGSKNASENGQVAVVTKPK